MNLSEMQKMYDDIISINSVGEKITALFNFEKSIVSADGAWALNFLYEKLRSREDWDVYLRCRLALK